MRLKTAILGGVGWTTFVNIAGQALSLVTIMVLARLLVPSDFGLVSMVLVFTHFAAIFADFGLASAIVHRKDISSRQLDTLFWMNLIVGGVLLIIVLACAKFIATFYEEPTLTELTYGLSLCFVFIALGIVPAALMRKQLRFKLYPILTIIAAAISSVTAVVCALFGLGAWSLVVQAAVQTLSASILYLIFGGFTPSFRFNPREAAPLLRYGLWFTGYNAINFWAKNIDKLIIGKLFGTATLGYYTHAYSLMRLPVTQVMGSLSGVMFPALASVQNDHAECRKIYLKTMSLLSMATFPIAIGMLVMAEPIVFTILGPQWGRTASLLQILAVTGLSSTYSNPTGWLYTSQGQTGLMFWWGVFGSGSLIAGISIGALYGTAEAVAVGYTIAHVLLVYPSVVISGRLIGLRFSNVFSVTAGPLVCSAIMGVVVWLTSIRISEWPAGIQLLTLLPQAALLYCALIFLFRLQAAHDAIRLIKESMNPTRDSL